MSMALQKEELEIIGEYVQSHSREWLPELPHATVGSIYPIRCFLGFLYNLSSILL